MRIHPRPEIPGTTMGSMLFIAGLFCSGVFSPACRPGMSDPRVEDRYLHPFLGNAEAPSSTTDSLRPAAKPEPERQPRSPASPPGQNPAKTGGFDPVPALASKAAGAPHDARKEVVASAVRLLGITGSFDERSFLGHVLRVNALLPPGVRPATYSPASALQAARTEKRLVEREAVQPGDVVFFECAAGCGTSVTGKVAAGIVESVDAHRIGVIAYTASTVKRCGVGQDLGAVIGFARVVEGN